MSTIRWNKELKLIFADVDETIAEVYTPENPKEFLQGYNIILWNGQKNLHHGLLEYLEVRHTSVV